MKTTTQHTRHPHTPRRRATFTLDPYTVDGTTFTRQEILRARGMTVKARKRHPAKRHG